MFEFIKSIPPLILDGLKALFIPSDGEIEGVIDEIKTAFNDKLGVGQWSVDSAFGAEKAMEDSTTTLQFGGYTFTVKLIDWSYVKNALGKFRPYIRGFLAFLLCLYSTNQFLGLIGQPTLSTIGSSVPDGGKDISRGNEHNYWSGW